jgi:hypothetical protein
VHGASRVGAPKGIEVARDVLDVPFARVGGVAGALEAAVGQQCARRLDVVAQAGLVGRHGASVGALAVRQDTATHAPATFAS